MGFLNRLYFTSSNEDGASEIDVLRDAKKILCLTGSGGRALDLLLTDATEIVALDMNSAQNALLALKMAAISHLDYQEYLRFIGVIYDSARLRTLEKLMAGMSIGDKEYWQKNAKKVQKGVWYSGLWERVLCANAQGLRLLKGRQIKQLFAASTVKIQEEIWKRAFDGPLLRWLIRLSSNKFLWTHVLGEPGGAFLPSSDEVADILARRFRHAASQFLFSASDFAKLIFEGRQNEDNLVLPLHMQAHNYQRVKDRLKCIRILTGRLDDLESLQICNIDGFSLSDFGSYCSHKQYRDCWKGIMAASANGALFCERLFMVNHQLPFTSLQCDEAYSRRLSEKDMAIVYQIRVGTIGDLS